MEWLLPLAEVVLQLLVELGPALCSSGQTTSSRVESHAEVEPDNWKCPSPQELAQILPNAGSQLNLPIVADEPSSTSPRAHPLWDRELDF
jgi:hypothetical protein